MESTDTKSIPATKLMYMTEMNTLSTSATVVDIRPYINPATEEK